MRPKPPHLHFDRLMEAVTTQGGGEPGPVYGQKYDFEPICDFPTVHKETYTKGQTHNNH